MTGLASVTFRGLSEEEVIELASQAGLDGIEWGSDVHAPPGKETHALSLRKKTEDAGLRVLSYGSYYRLCENSNPLEAFRPVLVTARALGAPNIRVWPGALPPDKADCAYLLRAAWELRMLGEEAARFGIRISTEYHRGALTETAAGALKLMELTSCNHVSTYWQPDPCLSREENVSELTLVLPFVSNLHVFHRKGKTRLSLEEGAGDWMDYLRLAGGLKLDSSFLMEFVREDSPELFLKDAAVLKHWIAEFLPEAAHPIS